MCQIKYFFWSKKKGAPENPYNRVGFSKLKLTNMKPIKKTNKLMLGKKAITNLCDKNLKMLVAGNAQITSNFLCFSHRCSEPCQSRQMDCTTVGCPPLL